MKLANKIFSIVLVVLLVATVYGLIRTGRESSIPAGNGTAAATGPEQAAPVDQTPLLTAQALAQHADQRGGAAVRAAKLCSLGIRRWIWRLRWRCSTRRSIRPH